MFINYTNEFINLDKRFFCRNNSSTFVSINFVSLISFCRVKHVASNYSALVTKRRTTLGIPLTRWKGLWNTPCDPEGKSMYIYIKQRYFNGQLCNVKAFWSNVMKTLTSRREMRWELWSKCRANDSTERCGLRKALLMIKFMFFESSDDERLSRHSPNREKLTLKFSAIHKRTKNFLKTLLTKHL